MGTCSVCNEDGLTRNCNHCGREVCSTHTLPEKHNCPAIAHAGNDTKPLQSDINAKLSDETADANSSRDKSRTDSGDSRQPSNLDRSPASNNTDKVTERPGGDSSPDVAPDGSIAEPSTISTPDADTQTSTGLRERLQSAKLKFQIYWRKAFVLATSVRVWIVVLVAVASMGQLGFAPVPGLPVDDGETGAAIDGVTSWAGGLLEDHEINKTKIEREIHQKINERRRANGLEGIEMDTDLRRAARSHSNTVSEEENIVIEGPVGESLQEQYADHGIECRVPVGDGSYSTGAANYGYTYAWENVETDRGKTVYHSNEQEVAEGIVNQWMNDSGSQDVILTDYWRSEGIGVSVVEVDGKTRVYVTQYFC